MIPQFILDTCAKELKDDDNNPVYYFSTADRDGWVMYWPATDDTFHTYRDPAEWF